MGRNDIAAVSRTLSPSVVLAAYRRGIFPWPVSQRLVPWVSPDPRAVFPLDDPPHWSRSLRRTMRRGIFTVTVNRAFRQVVEACGTDRDEGTWITPDVISTYVALHAMGWAHSVEVWAADDGSLAGGLYGIALGGVFAGESMFHRRTDASKVAFATVAERSRARGFSMFDVQVLTPHLESLGCMSIARAEFLDRLERALTVAARFGGDEE
jgi:leucyl/phenylalanyl-tRNA--protein transferase